MFEALIRVKSTHLIKSSFKTRKKETMEVKKFLHKSLSKKSFGYRIHSLLRRAEARGSAGIIYRI